MAPEISDALCGLCRAHGWCYGVCWRFDRRDPRLLVIGESYYEEQIATGIDKTITQLHLVGEGTIGAVALSGKHQWVHSDDFCEGNTQWQHQFFAGMKTIVIISLPSFGVVQFGSSNKICENLEFLDQVWHLFCQRENTTDHSQPGRHAYATQNIHDSCSNRSINSLRDGITKELRDSSERSTSCVDLQDNAKPSTSHVISSNHFPPGTSSGTLSQDASTNPHSLAVPVNASRSGVPVSVNNSFLKIPNTSDNSWFHATSQSLAPSVETQVLLLPHNNLQSNHSLPSNPSSTNLKVNIWAKETTSLPLSEQRLLPDLSVNSLSSASHMSPFQYYQGNSISAHATMHGSGKLIDSSSSSPTKSSSKSSFIASEPSDIFLSFPQDCVPEHSLFLQFKDDHVMNDQTDLSYQSSVHVTDNRTLSTNDNITSVENEGIGCSPSSSLPCKPVEISVSSAMVFEDTGCNWKDSSSSGTTQFVLDNDLFEGIELDLSPRLLRPESWYDMIMPCSNLTTSVSDCMPEMEMGSFAAADKGILPLPGFEQLLEAAVGEGAHLSSSHSSIPSNVSSISSLVLDHQLSTASMMNCPQRETKPAPPAEFSLEKIIQQSSKEALLKSHVSPWIDGSCMRNAKGIVTNQPKRSEEATKVVRKRARPGESTRPRPKDRQQIQDRVKELREIVPNGAKCSIDALLDRTIKHMLFLQSVTKYADKLKQTDEPKMIGDESGVVLKDNSGSGAGCGGATWAYEVAGQTMVCPILVEDLNPPGQMLVEMLCEERGFFLEIADIIRGFGLTILRGVMEIKASKIWARFLVEANRDVTRMDIFLSLVQLLQQTSSIRTNEQHAKAQSPDKGVFDTFSNFQQPPVPIAISLDDRLQ